MRFFLSHHRILYSLLVGLAGPWLPGVTRAQNTPASVPPQAVQTPPSYQLGVWIEPAYRWTGAAWVPYGVRVTAVSPGSAALRGGIQVGDVIAAVNGSAVPNPQNLLAAIARSGGRATILVRDERTSTTRQIASLSLAAPATAPPLPQRAVARPSPPATLAMHRLPVSIA